LRVPDKELLGVHRRGSLGRFIDATFAVPTRSEAYKYAAYDGLMRLARRVEKRGR
jgi:hypothetical protein